MNNIICKNCSAENPPFELVCRNCKAYIRERVVNIDLWKTIGQIIETPFAGYRSIVYAEHKNFIFLIALLASAKLLIDVMLLSVVTSPADNPFSNFFSNYFIVTGLLLSMAAVFALVQKIISRKDSDTRFKDNFSVLIYSFFPQIFGLIILFPIEMVVFGGFLFSDNPSPFVLKETLAYTFLGFEGLIILWQIFLTTIAFINQSNTFLTGILLSLIFNALLYYILYLFSYLII